MANKFYKAYDNSANTVYNTKLVVTTLVSVLSLGLVYIALTSHREHHPSSFLSSDSFSIRKSFRSHHSDKKTLSLLTWNIAAINNNPFEYWISFTTPEGEVKDDPVYVDIMDKVSNFIESPESHDRYIHEFFTNDMYDTLEKEMIAIGWNHVNETRAYWEANLKGRKMLSEFIKDPVLGKKRLASMPDRVSNTINTLDGAVYRPTVINCYDGKMDTVDDWWKNWLEFMFHKEITVERKGKVTSLKVYQMLSKIKKSKYPSLTEEEEEISIPLQTVTCALFDVILLQVMNAIDGSWNDLRSNICQKLNLNKMNRTIEILENSYHDRDIIFLQEVASSFARKLSDTKLATMYDVFYPSVLDGDRDQNSFILLKKNLYTSVTEVTKGVLDQLDSMSSSPAPVMKGDLLALTVVDSRDGTKYLLGSFHGDTNGLATIPIVRAMHAYATTIMTDHKLLFGMDANTYAHAEDDQQGVVEFAEFYRGIKLNSCYGETPNPLNFTTFHARTHLQAQLNKAITAKDRDRLGDKNPKDFIVFFKSDFEVESTEKDNTGMRKYIENMVFPTLYFPSDHGITFTSLREVPAK